MTIAARFITHFETGLAKPAANLTKLPDRNKLADIHQRIGRLTESSLGIAQPCDITVTADEPGDNNAVPGGIQ